MVQPGINEHSCVLSCCHRKLLPLYARPCPALALLPPMADPAHTAIHPCQSAIFHSTRPSAATNSSCAPGGSDCFSLVAFSASVTHRVYRYLLQRTLNFVVPVLVFLILTDRASLRRAVSRKSLISVIWRGCGA